MLISANLDRQLWSEAVNTACYILNRVLVQSRDVTPFEEWFNKKPNIKHFKVFGVTAYLKIPKELRKKFDSVSSQPLIFVGYDGESENYRLWDKSKRKVHISNDVEFHENGFDFEQSNKADNSCKIDIDFGDLDFRMTETLAPATTDQFDCPENAICPENVVSPENVVEADRQQATVEHEPTSTRQLRDRSTMFPPDRYGVPVALLADVYEVTYDEVMALLAQVQHMTYAEAMRSSDACKWKEAVADEMQALEHNQTWVLTPLPPGERKTRCKWVFSIKSDLENGSKRFKARLVAKGCSQREGICLIFEY